MHFNINNFAVGTALLDILQKSYAAESGYKKVASQSDEKAIKQFLLKKSKDRKYFNQEIRNEINKLDTKVDSQIDLSLMASNLWKDIKAILTASNKSKANIEEVIKVDRAIVESYNKVLVNNTVPNRLHNLLFSQRNQVKKDIELFSKLKKV